MGSRKPFLYRVVGRFNTNGHVGTIRRRDRALGVGAYAHCDTCDWSSTVHARDPKLTKTHAAWAEHVSPPAGGAVGGEGHG